MEEMEEDLDENFPTPAPGIRPPEPISSVDEIVTISIDSYRIEEGRVKKHVVYIIRGQDSAGLFEATRRYKEFMILRSCLLNTWPACYVPKLPKKKAVGNLSTDLIHKRKKLLDYFAGKIVGNGFLFKSEAFQLFIRGPPDFLKGSQSLKALNYVDLHENFQKTFPEAESFEMSSAHDEEVSKFLGVIEEALRKIREFKKSCKQSALAYYRYEDSLTTLSNKMSQITNYFYPTKESNAELKKKSSNPYKVLLDWARREILEIESMIEVVEKKEYLESVLNKSQAKLGKQQQGLENFQSGKKSLLQRLTKKSDEQKIKEIEHQIADSEKELVALQHVIRIATGRMVIATIPMFKEKEAEKLESIIRSYSGVVVEDYNEFVSYLESLQEIITPTVI